MLIHILIFRCSSRPLIKERLTTDTNKDQDREKFKELERNNYNFFQKEFFLGFQKDSINIYRQKK
jgi:hypothetical protein